jgi:hypothetical protein
MVNRQRPRTTTQRDTGSDRFRWLVPATLGMLGLLTMALVLFALGVLVGVVRY